MRHIARAMVLLALAAGIGAAVNAARPGRLAWYVERQKIYREPTAAQRARAIAREQIAEALDRGAVLFDARDEKQYTQGHIPGAINVPAEQAAERIDVFYAYAAPDDEVILYCGGAECEDSLTVYDLLVQYGYTNVRLYLDGWRDWYKAGLPIDKGAGPAGEPVAGEDDAEGPGAEVSTGSPADTEGTP